MALAHSRFWASVELRLYGHTDTSQRTFHRPYSYVK
jgi:hypothetical protein